MTSRAERAHERMLWVLRLLAAKPYKGGVAWDQDDVDAFVDAFPEADATLIIYSMGPHSSPMLNRAARRAQARGLLRAGRVGNQDARSFNQRTWCRYWSLTEDGLALLARERSA